MKTHRVKKKEITKRWFLIDAAGVVLGRLSAHVAMILQGKNKATYEPHLDCGDNVIIINADQVLLTGKKETDKTYYRHTGYPGGIKTTTPARQREKGYSDRILRTAIEGMVPGGPRGRQMLRGLYIYNGGQHKQEAQQPVVIKFAQQSRKNTKEEDR